jgi:hypothetical protein
MKDPKTEQYLTAGNFKWDYAKKVLFRDIDLKASEDNPSRLLRSLNQEVAITYGLAMERGDEFPAIVLLGGRENGKYLIATGVHRVAGAQLANIDHFDAYVVIEPDGYREEVLIRQLNIFEGYGVSIQDRINQILLLHEKYPDKPLAQLAREWNLKEATVKSAWHAVSALKRGERCGYDFTRAKVPKSMQVALNGIHSEVVYQKAAQLAITPGVNGGDIDTMVREIKKAPREEAAGLAIVDRYAHEATQRRIQSKAKHGRISPIAAHKLIGDCKRVLNQIDKGMDHLHLSALVNPYSALLVVEETMKYLKSVAAELERLKRIRDSSGVTTTVAVH